MDEELRKLISTLQQQLDAQTFDALLRVSSKLDRYRRILTVWEVGGIKSSPIKNDAELGIVVMKREYYEELKLNANTLIQKT